MGKVHWLDEDNVRQSMTDSEVESLFLKATGHKTSSVNTSSGSRSVATQRREK
jgi:hypothetical protein